MAENTNTEREKLDVAMSRACVQAWDSSGYTTGKCDAVHPMFAAAFEMGYRASLSLPAAGQEPVAEEFHYDEMAVELRRIAHKPGSVAVSGTLLRAAAALEARAAPQPAVAAGWVMVPVKANTAIACAIENEVDSQLVASSMDPRLMQRQDGFDIWASAIAARPPAPSTEGERNG